MNLGRMELTSITKSFSSERARVFSWNTTLIVSKMVNAVLLTIFLQLVKSVFSIWASNRLILGDHTSAISLISAVLHLILKFWHTLIQIRVLLARQIIWSTILSYWQNLIGFSNISEHIGVWLMLDSLFACANVRMILLSKASVLFLNLLRRCRHWNIKDSVIVLFQTKFYSLSGKASLSYLKIKIQYVYRCGKE